jgi:hypothetical protein
VTRAALPGPATRSPTTTPVSRSPSACPTTPRRNQHLRVASRLQHNGVVRRILAIAAPAALAASAALPACFYVDPINERPSAEIIQDTADPGRGTTVEFHAEWSDPDNDKVQLAWAAYACDGAGACDPVKFDSRTDPVFDVMVPQTRADGTTIEAVSITLDVQDRWGAVARPQQRVTVPVVDAAPTVSVQDAGHTFDSAYPVGLPITFTALATDPDDATVTLDWQLSPAIGSVPGARSFGPRAPDPKHPELVAYDLVPDVPGLWTVRVTATDPQGGTGQVDRSVQVAADQPPCLGALDPGLTGGTIVVDQARRFAVLSVSDDINVYPAPSASDPYLRAAGFHWSLASPATGGALVPLDWDGNDVVVDPADYAPGDELDLRVEISDAVDRTLPCADEAATCSIEANACLQRQTWHLEIR